MQESQLLNNLFAQSVNQHRRELGAEPLGADQVFSETAIEPAQPTAATELAQPPQPPGPVATSAQPNEIVPRSTGYATLAETSVTRVETQPTYVDSMSQVLTQALSRLSDPTHLSREIYAQASSVIPEFSQAPSCATCKASTLDSSLNQLTCQNYGVLVLSNYICSSHQVFTQTQPVEPTKAEEEQPEELVALSDPVITPSDLELFNLATSKAQSRTELSPEDQEIYAVVLYNKAFEKKTGSTKGAFSSESELSSEYISSAKKKMSDYRKNKSNT